VDEIIFAIAHSHFDMNPIPFDAFPVMSFNYDKSIEIPSKLQTEGGQNLVMNDYIPFIHMFDKMEGDNFKNILIVDDMNDSGATINWIIQDWQNSCFPGDPSWEEVWNGNVKFAVLFDNLGSNCDVKMDFVGEEVNKEAENNIWIDFPYEDWWAK
jgi:hypothetical protein